MIESKPNMGEVSDGYHTFNELYAHRRMLFIALMHLLPRHIIWRSRLNSEGESWDGWFLAGAHLNSGDISYHLPNDDWELLDMNAIETLGNAPAFDGHNSNDVLERLRAWIVGGNETLNRPSMGKQPAELAAR